MPALELLVKPLIERPGNATELSTPGCVERDVAHRADHLFGAIERRAVGQSREADQILLVLARHEAARHLLEQADGYADQNDDRPRSPRPCRR